MHAYKLFVSQGRENLHGRLDVVTDIVTVNKLVLQALGPPGEGTEKL